MSERITAGTISGCGERTIEVHSAVEMFAGGYERKKHLEGTLGTKHISLIERSGSPEKLQYYAKHWQAFRDIGLPVVPTLRTSSSGSLLATDLKADGSELYGKGLRIIVNENAKKRFRPRPRMDEYFMALYKSEAFQLSLNDNLCRYKEIANLNDIALPYDDAFELRICPDGSWSIVILDLTFARIPGLQYDTCSYIVRSVSESNELAVSKFLTNLDSINEVMPSLKERWSQQVLSG